MTFPRRSLRCCLAFIFVLIAGFLPPRAAFAAPPDASEDALIAELGDGVRLSYHNGTGEVRFIGTPPLRPIDQSFLGIGPVSPEDAARTFLSGYGSLFGLSDQSQELIVMRQTTGDKGREFVRFQQLYENIPIFGGELIVQLNAQNSVVSANGEILPALDLAVTPQIDSAGATQTALAAVAKWHNVDVATLVASEPALWIYDPVLVGPGDGPTQLVWRLEVSANSLQPIDELVLIDAQRGSVALHFNQVDTLLDRLTYTANDTDALPGTLVCDETNPTCTGGDADAIAAHLNIADAYNFYATHHGRDSVDNAGMTLVSTVKYCPDFFSCPYANAFWSDDEQQMVYGAGYAVSDDVVAHELTHGITDHESGLFYYYQSGAINESFSDIWGEFVDLTNSGGNDLPAVRWQLGEDLPIGAIRNMQDPPLFGDPDRVTSPNYYLEGGDSGGVHLNSGVNNKAAYLMTDGDTFNGKTIAPLGINKVAVIYYEVQTNLAVSGSDYADLYDMLYQACLNKVGSVGITASDCQQVRNATDAVEMNLQPVADFNTDAPLCPVGEAPSTLFFDDLETDASQWVLDGIVGATRWGYGSPNGPFAHSGEGFLFADDFPAAVSDSFAALLNSVEVPAAAYLHFAHAYGFDQDSLAYYDGGVLEYSTNGGTTWLDAEILLDFNGYDGTLSSDFDNPLAGRQAFLGDSHGYITSRADLASLAGENVNFRWRMGLDSSIYVRGWWLDDVHIYTCAQAETLTVTKSGTGSGTVASTPAGITCGADCTQEYANGTAVALNATAAAGSRFGGWTGDCTGSAACDFTLDAAKSVDARFDLCYALTLSHTGNGANPVPAPTKSTGCAAGSYVAGAAINLTAAPAAGSQVNSWGGTTNDASTATTNAVTMPAANHAASVAYEATPETLTVTKSGTGSGSVTSTPAGITCGADCTQEYANGTAVTLNATAAAGSTFGGWTGACTGSAACDLTLDAAKSVDARFDLCYALTLSHTGNGANPVAAPTKSTGCAAGSYVAGAAINLTAAPAAGSQVNSWGGTTNDASTATTNAVTMPAANHAASVTYGAIPVTLTVTKSGTGSGSVTSTPAGITCGADCTQEYPNGTAVTLNATAAAGSTFGGWTGACTGSAACNLTLDAAKSVTALFTLNDSPDNHSPNFTSTAGLSVTAGTLYTYSVVATDPDAGDVLTLTAPTKPTWLTLASTGNGTATLSGTPGLAHVGDVPVQLRVQDAVGAFATQAFTITVVADVTTGNVQGKVVDAEAQGVAGATVTITDADVEVMVTAVITQLTNESGDYLFEAVPVGDYSLTISMEGKQTSTPVEITVQAGQTMTVPAITLTDEEQPPKIFLPSLGKAE